MYVKVVFVDKTKAQWKTGNLKVRSQPIIL